MSAVNHFVGAAEYCDGEGDAERLGGLHVDDQLDPRGLLHRQVGGLPLENAAGIGAADQTVRVQGTDAVAHQTDGRSERMQGVELVPQGACALSLQMRHKPQ